MTAVHDFYRAFEDRHRGSREEILTRLRVYLPFVLPVVRATGGAGAVDVGCGRGEWMELLASCDVPVVGADLDEGMLEAARAHGLDARREDAVAFLGSLPADSRAVVSGFQLAEHLPFEALQALVREALRVLRPGGLLILETPNPENLQVGSANFYTDPTHERPLPPLLLSFLAEHAGFARVKVLRLNDHHSLRGERAVELMDVIGGTSPDYAIVAQKARADDAASDDWSRLEKAFARERGQKLDDLSRRWESQWDQRIAAEVRGLASRMDEVLKEALDARHVANLAAERAVTQQLRLDQELTRANAQVAALLGSTSWRVTAPLRWASAQAIALRQQGPKARLRRAARKVVRVFAGPLVRRMDRSVKLRVAVGNAARRAGLESVIARVRGATSNPVAPVPAVPVPIEGDTSAAGRAREALENALAARAREGS